MFRPRGRGVEATAGGHLCAIIIIILYGDYPISNFVRIYAISLRGPSAPRAPRPPFARGANGLSLGANNIPNILT